MNVQEDHYEFMRFPSLVGGNVIWDIPHMEISVIYNSGILQVDTVDGSEILLASCRWFFTRFFPNTSPGWWCRQGQPGIQAMAAPCSVTSPRMWVIQAGKGPGEPTLVPNRSQQKLEVWTSPAKLQEKLTFFFWWFLKTTLKERSGHAQSLWLTLHCFCVCLAAETFTENSPNTNKYLRMPSMSI